MLSICLTRYGSLGLAMRWSARYLQRAMPASTVSHNQYSHWPTSELLMESFDDNLNSLVCSLILSAIQLSNFLRPFENRRPSASYEQNRARLVPGMSQLLLRLGRAVSCAQLLSAETMSVCEARQFDSTSLSYSCHQHV